MMFVSAWAISRRSNRAGIGSSVISTEISIDERQHNAHSAAGALRGWFTAPGAHDELHVSLIDTVVPVTIADAAREMIGDKPAVRYDGMLRNKHAFSVWVSDDTARVPLRLTSGSKIGHVDVELVSYSVPAE